MVEQKATKLISYCTGQQTGIDTPFVSYRKKYQPYRLRTGHTDKIRLFQPINAYRTETRKKKKNVLTLSSLHSPASLAVSQTHSAWSFLPQTPNLLDWHSPSLFQIYFLFSLSSFFFLLSWLRPMYAK